MPLSASRLAWLQIHFCVLLWGFTAILGKLITLESVPLVLWRMGLVATALLLWPRVWRAMLELSARLLWSYIAIGCVVALHWLTFYGAIKLANASVAATCIATVPIFLALIEPRLTGRPFRWWELALGLLAVPGIALLVGGTPEHMNIGIVVGISSAAFAALFAALNKRLIMGAGALAMTTIEMGSGAMFLALLYVALTLAGVGEVAGIFDAGQSLLPNLGDSMWLLILAFGCTLLPFALSLMALRHLSAYASALAVNLEPVYAIILAIILLGEQAELEPTFYLGAALIIGVVVIYPRLLARRTL
ncbi:MAG: DMT family transporter [Gammaproteobacteria bacterium]|nr:DMT family transporter [Gammaproteobacteria bacterium]